MDVPLTLDSIVHPHVNQAQIQLANQLKRMDQKAFAKKLLIGSTIWFAGIGVLAAGMKLQQAIDETKAAPQQ